MLNQRLAKVRDISFQVFASHEILDEAFQSYMDDLCVPRQLSILLKLPREEVCSDFDAIIEGADWRKKGVSPDKGILSVAQRPSLPARPRRPHPGQVRACSEGGSGTGLRGFQRARLLLQVCQSHHGQWPWTKR